MILPYAVMLSGIISLSFANIPNITWCTVSEDELSKCKDLTTAMIGEPFNFQCTVKDTDETCLAAIKSGEADAITVDGGDIYRGGLLPEPRLKPIAAENTTGSSCYYAVAVVKQRSNFGFRDLRGKRSCHTGLGKSAGWIIPIGTILKYNLTSWDGLSPIEKVAENFFSSSCVPGANPAFPKLCALCNGTDGNHCKRSHVEPYYDYSGAFQCLKDDAGEVAFVKHTTVPVAERQNYELLCLDGTRKPIEDYKECFWAKVPAHAVVVRRGNVEDEKNEAIWRFLSRAQELFGPLSQASFKIFDSSKYGRKDLMFKDSTQNLIQLPSGMDSLLYLGSEYSNAIRTLESGNRSALNPCKIRWCTIGQLEQQKCNSWGAVNCVMGLNAEDCIKKIMFGDADAASLDGGEVYVGGKCGLVPVMAEYYNKTDLEPCKPTAVNNKTPSYYAVAVVKDPQLNWETLRGKKSCHTAVGGSAGWNVPMGLLSALNKIRACEVFNSTYFSESCAPGANADLHPKLCSLCIGSQGAMSPTDKCAANSNERYYGYSGAFRCLVEVGDVAFVKHTTVPENTNGNGKADWNRDLIASDYYLLCKNGSTVPVDQFMSCHLADVPSHAVMARPDNKAKVLKLLKNELLRHSRGGSEESKFAMFNSVLFSGKDLLFKDSTQCLIEVPVSDYKSYLGDSYIHIMEGLQSCEPLGEATASAEDKVRWCTTSEEEQNKCNNWTSVSCVQADSMENCLRKVSLAEADAVVLHSSTMIAAEKYGLVPVMTEYYDKENLEPCRDPAMLKQSFPYIVAVVKNQTLTWDTLKGMKACYTALNRTGWNIPMGLLIAQGKIKNCSLYHSTFFSESCAAGADPASTLCSLCAGDENSTSPGKDKCAFSDNEIYGGYNGAFRCLAEKGDVTFIRHTTIFENTDGNSPEEWAAGLRSSDFRLLCLNGTQAPVTDYKTCHLAQVAARTVASRPEMRDQVLQLLKEQQLKHGRGGSEEDEFAMFDSTKFQGRRLLFSDSTQCLVEVPTADFTHLLGEGYVTAMEGLYTCEPPVFIEDVTSQVDNGDPVDVYLDFTKAFGMVLHRKLIPKIPLKSISSAAARPNNDLTTISPLITQRLVLQLGTIILHSLWVISASIQ
ncbi:serotransferrin-B-like [Mustelus asterias]